MIECKECGVELSNFLSLSKHILHHHKMTSEEYYVKHCGRGVCCVCGNQTTFINLNEGFKHTCSKKCGAIKHRADMRNDPSRFNQFRDKVSFNMIKYWNTVDPVARSKRIAKVAAAIKQAVAAMSVDERKERFGWMNKLTPDEKRQAIKCMIETGSHRWWRESTQEMKDEVIERRADTLRSTWDNHGADIMQKQISTQMKNRSLYNDTHFEIDDEMIKSMQEVFNLE